MEFIKGILVDDAELVYADVGWKPKWFSVNVELRINVLRPKIVVLDKSEWLQILNKKIEEMGRMWIKYGHVNGNNWDTEGSI